MRTAVLLVSSILIPALVFASTLININTADATLLDTLPGIGPAYATRIIDYRTAHGPFTRIEDIQNVSGIGPSTYAGIEPFITVGDTQTSGTPSIASSTPNPPPLGGATTYVPPPFAISVHIDGDTFAFLETPLHLSAHVTTKNGGSDPGAQISWSFGDGSSAVGSDVEKTFRYAGTYLIVASAADGSAKSRDEIVVTAKPAAVRVRVDSGDGITIVNDEHERLDLSGWKIIADKRTFSMPEGTMLLPNTSVLFPSAITNLIAASDVALAYPSGIIAARGAPPPVAGAALALEQPIAPVASYRQVSEVEPIPSASTNAQSYDEAVDAPTAAPEPAAVGAASLPPPPAQVSPPSGVFKSPWTLGLLGIIVAASGAFIFL